MGKYWSIATFKQLMLPLTESEHLTSILPTYSKHFSLSGPMRSLSSYVNDPVLTLVSKLIIYLIGSLLKHSFKTNIQFRILQRIIFDVNPQKVDSGVKARLVLIGWRRVGRWRLWRSGKVDGCLWRWMKHTIKFDCFHGVFEVLFAQLEGDEVVTNFVPYKVENHRTVMSEIWSNSVQYFVY